MLSFRRCAGSWIATVFIILMMIGAGACAAEGEAASAADSQPRRTAGPQDAKVEGLEVPELKQSAGAADVKLQKEAELKQRVQARWNAVIKGDLDVAYSFETPEYRKAYTERDYEKEFGRRVLWHLATLKDLRYDREDEVETIVSLDYSFALPGSDQMARTTADITERWVYSEGQWWRQHEQRSLGGKTQSQPSLPQ